MPELPEVETIVRDLKPRLTNTTLRNPRLYKSDVLRRVSPRRLLATLRNATVLTVMRRAKHVVIELTNGHRVVIQPRMTGNLLIYDRTLSASERRYAVLRVSIDDGGLLVYRDVRRLGTIWLLNGKQWQSYTASIGPEPLEPDFDAEQLYDILHRTRQPVKKALMDQRLIAGIGNIYANEALFRAGIDPSRPSHRVARPDTDRLHAAVRDILNAAVSASGTTIRDYRTGTGESGSYQFVLQAYGRGGQPCRVCGTRLHTTHVIDNRATTFCWRCQGKAS
jgi:formamidopyrimidine-DNA glycosylase